MEILSFLTNLDSHIAAIIGAYGNQVYLILFAILFLEIGIFPFFFLPGNPLIFVAGSFCSLGSLHLAPTLISAASLDNIVSYKIGNAYACKINRSHSGWVNKKAMAQTKAVYEKYGQLTLMISGFIAVVRTFVPLLAGISKCPSDNMYTPQRQAASSGPACSSQRGTSLATLPLFICTWPASSYRA
ncbi:MAG: membrane-associated protein [Methylophilaceae bacterium]|jgi:membrane-associated protein